MTPDLRGTWRFRLYLVRGFLIALAALLLVGPLRASSASVSSYALAQQAPFNRPEHYPLTRTVDPALYRPNGEWIGRLILPAAAEQGERDWVWMEVQHAPEDSEAVVGRRVRLSWQDTPALAALVETVRTDVRFDAAARRSMDEGNVLPERLDGRRGVGPLQSLAGARGRDDVIVRLERVERDGTDSLRIGRPPVQVSGRYLALVQLLGSAGDRDRFRVRHYDRGKGGFEGPIETVRIPRQPPDRFGRRLSSPDGLSGHPDGAAGWYLYGAPDAEGVFTAQALIPRALRQVRSDQQVAGVGDGLRYIAHGNWAGTPERRGRSTRVQLQGAPWRLGDRGLLIHSFGGIGGRGGEPVPGATVTGHFAFGETRVIEDPFTGEPRFALTYHQIYANNPNGIVAGSQDDSAYTGDLQRGWLWLRPISDVLIRQEAFSDLPLGTRQLSLLDELGLQAEVLMARYRSGDGTGLASVTPATSCVQDSAQALFIAIRRLREQVRADRALLTWLEGHPRDPAARAFAQLSGLAGSLEDLLTPFGMVRSDWKHNVKAVAHPAGDKAFRQGESLRDGLLSWRSMLPRRAHDDISAVFLEHDAALWFVRSNQVPGLNRELVPLAPTLLFGQIPWLSTLLRRVTDALFTPLSPRGMALTLLVLGGYAALALPLGTRTGFLPRRWSFQPVRPMLRGMAGLLLLPALSEELVFRVALLPHPLEGVGLLSSVAWGALSVGLFVVYHPLAGATWYPAGRTVFRSRSFLGLCALLGGACVLAYNLTGSLWAPVLIHWLVVSLWLWPLKGVKRLEGAGGGAKMGSSSP